MKDYILDLDKPRKLKFGFKASRLVREKFGDKDFTDIKKFHVDEMPTIAWAGLCWEDENLSIEKVEELLDAQIPEKMTIVSCMEIIVAAMIAHIGGKPIPQKKKKKKQPKKLIPTEKTGS